jgi:hypothetical protein
MMMKRELLSLVGVLSTSTLLAIAACGSTEDPPCTTCDVKSRTTVKWSFNAYPERGFAMDSCVDFKVGKVAVDIVDADGFATSGVEMCGNAQSVFQGLAPGDYTVYLMPLDYDDAPLLSAPATTMITATDTNTETTVNVKWDQWLGGPYTGTFLFRLSWGGLSCDATAVKQQKLTLAVNGVIQNLTTDDGQALNGSDMKPCKKLTDNFPQSALGAAFGPATLLVEGFDETNAMRYSKMFETFVGAGITNPTLTFDVPTSAP